VRAAQDIEMPATAGTCAPVGSATIYHEPDNHRSRSFGRVPNELKLMIADYLDLGDINSLVRTSRAENGLLTPYIYKRAKDLKSRDGRPYFLKAVDTANLTAVRQFIEVGTSVNICDSDPTERFRATALHSCAHDGNIQIAQLLIQHGVNMSPVNDYEDTPLHYAVCREDSSETWVRLLVDAGADISASSRTCGTILETATMYGTPSVVQLLLQRGAIPTIPTARNLVQDTLLHCPPWHGTAATVRLFLDAGLNIEATNICGQTPLHRAAEYGRGDYVKEYLQGGANVDAIDSKGRTPLQTFMSWSISTSAARHILHHETLPVVCASKGSPACVPTCRSAEFDEPVVNLLLSAGANIRASKNSNRSPLDWATAMVLSAALSGITL
jgi:ankyrin repeat protein